MGSACVSSILRLWESIKVGRTHDKTYGLMAIYCWRSVHLIRFRREGRLWLTPVCLSVIEVCVGIVCSCLPMMPALYHHAFHPKRNIAEIMTSRRFQLDRALRRPPVRPDMCVESATDFTLHDLPSLRESGESRDTMKTTSHAGASTEAKLVNGVWETESIVVVRVKEAYPAGILRRQSIQPADQQPPASSSSSRTVINTSEPENKKTGV